MDFLKDLLGGHSSQLVSNLVAQAGFTPEQAQAFVPEATGRVAEAVKGADSLDFSNLSAAAQSVMGRIDVTGLAESVGIGTAQAENGLSAIVPQLLELFQQKFGGASEMLSKLGGEGGLGGIAGGLGKMFGR